MTNCRSGGDAMRPVVVLEEAVRGFPRYHQYTLGSDLRAQARQVCRLILRAYEAREHCVGWMSEAKSTKAQLRMDHLCYEPISSYPSDWKLLFLHGGDVFQTAFFCTT